MQTAARALPVPFVCSNQSQAAETDTSVAALIAPEQDVYVVLRQVAGSISQLSADVVGQDFKNLFELTVAHDPLQVEREVAQVTVGVQLPKDRGRARPLFFPLALPFVLGFAVRSKKPFLALTTKK